MAERREEGWLAAWLLALYLLAYMPASPSPIAKLPMTQPTVTSLQGSCRRPVRASREVPEPLQSLES